MPNVNEPCPHCKGIRKIGEEWITVLHMMQWPMQDVAQLCAYIHARIRFEGRKINESEEKGFLDFFNKICDTEFQELHHINPLEPKSFDEAYDFRTQMKNGE